MSDSEVSIRPCTPADRPAAAALAPRLQIGVASWRDSDAVGQAVTGWVEASLDARDAQDREVLVALLGGDVIGLVTVAERRHFTGELDAYVGELAVHADHERRGVGTLLMEAAENWARLRGLRHLTLETGAANTAARAFYAHRGYREEDVRLTKALTDAPSTKEDGLVNADIWGAVGRWRAWLDERNGTADLELTTRILKISEEAGEAAQAWIGVLGQNPRKGVTHTKDQVVGELADVAFTALVAIQSLDADARAALLACVAKADSYLPPARRAGGDS